MENKYRIGELSEKCDVTRRTIHYYVGRGLLPAPEGAGVGTYYCDDHLYRILLIKKYQENYLPLEEIKKTLTSLSTNEVKHKLEDGPEQVTTYVSESTALYETDKVYKRINLDFGVEIHYPAGNRQAEELANNIYHISKKYNREG